MVEAATGLDRRTFSAQIYALLEEKVVTGALVPGSRLSEELLAETFGVSRSPAREALADLERLGLAVRVGLRDRMVAIPTAELIREKFDLWWIVDSGRTYLAAQSATAADHATLRTYIDAMHDAIGRQDDDAYRAACDQFHVQIRTGCSNAFLNQSSTDCDVYVRWFETLYDRAPEISGRMVEEHYAILDAYERKDLGALYGAIHTHIMHQRERILAEFVSAAAAAGAHAAQRRKYGRNR